MRFSSCVETMWKELLICVSNEKDVTYVQHEILFS